MRRSLSPYSAFAGIFRSNTIALRSQVQSLALKRITNGQVPPNMADWAEEGSRSSLMYFLACCGALVVVDAGFGANWARTEATQEAKQANASDEHVDVSSLLRIVPNFSGVPDLEKKRDSAVCGWAQYSANRPVEDRFHIEKLPNGGWWFSVFDGHGGWQCSDYAHRILHRNFSVELNNFLGRGTSLASSLQTNINEHDSDPASLGEDDIEEDDENNSSYRGKIGSKVITHALRASFERTDRQYMAKVTGAFELGFGRDTRAGSCAIAVFIMDGVLFCANAGDCRAIVASTKKKIEKSEYGLFSTLSLPKFLTNRSAAKGNERSAASVVEKKGNLVHAASTESKDSTSMEKVALAVDLGEDLEKAALWKSIGLSCDPAEESTLRERLMKVLADTDQLDKNELLDEATRTAASNGTSQRVVPKVFSFLTSSFSSVAEAEPFHFHPFNYLYAQDEGTVKQTNEDLKKIDLSKFVQAFPLSTDHNAKLPKEQEKLKREHPNEPDIVICKSKNSCYVKGRLQPTRALGDFHLKYSEFRLPKKSAASASTKNGLELHYPFTPPYITCTPEVSVRKISREAEACDEVLILASDGLWDILSNQDVAEMVLKWIRIEGKTPKEAAEMLIDEALTISAKKNKMTLEELKQLKEGRSRRTKHDDMTVVVVDLSQVMDMFYFG